MRPLIRVEIHTDSDCILFQSDGPTNQFQLDIINCVALAFEKHYCTNHGKYKMTTTESGGMILELI